MTRKWSSLALTPSGILYSTFTSPLHVFLLGELQIARRMLGDLGYFRLPDHLITIDWATGCLRNSVASKLVENSLLTSIRGALVAHSAAFEGSAPSMAFVLFCRGFIKDQPT